MLRFAGVFGFAFDLAVDAAALLGDFREGSARGRRGISTVARGSFSVVSRFGFEIAVRAKSYPTLPCP